MEGMKEGKEGEGKGKGRKGKEGKKEGKGRKERRWITMDHHGPPWTTMDHH